MPTTTEREYAEAMRNVDATILKLAEQYAACDRKSAELNEERATIRANVEKLGIPSKSWQLGVSIAKNMTPGERTDTMNGLERVLSVLTPQAIADLFPEAAAKAQKRADKAAEEAATKGPDPSTNPRSDPKRGGAGGVDGKAPAKDKTEAKPAAASKPKPAPKPKGGDNVVELKGKTAKEAAGSAAKEGDALIRENLARQAQQPQGQPGDGSKADLNPPGEQEEGDRILKEGIANATPPVPPHDDLSPPPPPADATIN